MLDQKYEASDSTRSQSPAPEEIRAQLRRMLQCKFFRHSPRILNVRSARIITERSAVRRDVGNKLDRSLSTTHKSHLRSSQRHKSVTPLFPPPPPKPKDPPPCLTNQKRCFDTPPPFHQTEHEPPNLSKKKKREKPVFSCLRPPLTE
jgi:hypothetical protein